MSASHNHPRFSDPDYQTDRIYEQPAYDDRPDYFDELRQEDKATRKEVAAILAMIPSTKGTHEL